MTPEPDFGRIVQEELERLKAELPHELWHANGSLTTGSPIKGDLPRICSNGRQLRDISKEALRALQDSNDPQVLFVRGGMMVAVVRDEKKRHVISELGSMRSVAGLRVARIISR